MNDLIGKRIEITYMEGEPEYDGRIGTVEHIDSAGQLHETWGGCAVIPGTDSYRIIG